LNLRHISRKVYSIRSLGSHFDLPRSINAHQLTGHLRLSLKGFMNPLCQSPKVGIERIDDIICVICVCLMQVNKMFAIQGWHDAPFSPGKRQCGFIGYCPACLTAFIAG